MSLDDDLKLLEVKIQQLKLDYEQYFAGNRPREPGYERSQIQKALIQLTATPIKNTALRFKFNTINSRFQTFKRQWDTILRQIEKGTYKRQVFRADLRDRERQAAAASKPAASAAKAPDLFSAYRDAAASCGQDVKGLTRAEARPGDREAGGRAAQEARLRARELPRRGAGREGAAQGLAGTLGAARDLDPRLGVRDGRLELGLARLVLGAAREIGERGSRLGQVALGGVAVDVLGPPRCARPARPPARR